jgi:hypothetical protein
MVGRVDCDPNRFSSVVRFASVSRRMSGRLSRVRRTSTVGDEIARLWRRHQHAVFPARLRGEEVAGVDLEALNAEVVGCVEEWRSRGERLDIERRDRLVEAVERLDTVLPLLPSRAESLYFTRLHRVVAVVLAV